MIRTKHVLWAVAFGLVIPLIALAQQTPQASTPPAGTPPAAHHSSKPHTPPKININTATKEQLMTLPGMTDDSVDKLIAARPFKSKDQLVQKNIVTKEEYKKIDAKITAGTRGVPPKPLNTTPSPRPSSWWGTWPESVGWLASKTRFDPYRPSSEEVGNARMIPLSGPLARRQY
jgi:hypothetical protein